MKLRSVIILFTVLLFAQLSLLGVFAVRGQAPNLILAAAIPIVAYFYQGYRCLPVALCAMLLLDICAARYVGAGAFSLTAALILVMILRTQLNEERWLPQMATAVPAVLAYSLSYWGILTILGTPMHFLTMVRSSWITWILDLFVVTLFWLYFALRKDPAYNEEPLEIILEEKDLSAPYAQEMQSPFDGAYTEGGE